MTNERMLLQIKERIDQAKTKVAELTGQQDYLLKELEREHDVTSIKDGERAIRKMDKVIAGMDESIEAGLAEVKEKWDV